MVWHHSPGGSRLNENGRYQFYHVYISIGFHSRMLVRSKDLSAVERKMMDK